MTAAKRKHASATKAQRDPFDDYPTPKWAVHRLLDADLLPMHGRWLEPFAGAGNIIVATQNWCASWREPHAPPEFDAWEIQERYAHNLSLAAASVWTGDALAQLRATANEGILGKRYDVIVTNPPFAHAFEAVQLATKVARVGALLLRNDFLGSEERSDWLREHVPTQACIPNRPSFRDAVRERWRCPNCKSTEAVELDEAPHACATHGCGCARALFVGLAITGSDSAEYSWFVWDERTGRRGSLLILDSTPNEIRGAEIAERRALLLPELARTRPHIAAWLQTRRGAKRVAEEAAEPATAETGAVL